VPYAAGGGRFLGATFDPTALYRLVAVQDWLQSLGLDVARIRAHVLALQRQFLAGRARGGWLAALPLALEDEAARGSFLVFRDERAPRLHDRLLEAGILVDCRADRLRVGFGLHQDAADVDEFFRRTAASGPAP
jgi:selenocysteine lyase/cysteine desulfurase